MRASRRARVARHPPVALLPSGEIDDPFCLCLSVCSAQPSYLVERGKCGNLALDPPPTRALPLTMCSCARAGPRAGALCVRAQERCIRMRAEGRGIFGERGRGCTTLSRWLLPRLLALCVLLREADALFSCELTLRLGVCTL